MNDQPFAVALVENEPFLLLADHTVTALRKYPSIVGKGLQYQIQMRNELAQSFDNGALTVRLNEPVAEHIIT